MITSRTGFPPPPIYDTVEFTVILHETHVDSHTNVAPLDDDEDLLKIEVDLERFQYLRDDPEDAFSVIPLAELARIVQKEIVLVYQRAKHADQEGCYMIQYKKDIPAYTRLEALKLELTSEPNLMSKLPSERLSEYRPD